MHKSQLTDRRKIKVHSSGLEGWTSLFVKRDVSSPLPHSPRARLLLRGCWQGKFVPVFEDNQAAAVVVAPTAVLAVQEAVPPAQPTAEEAAEMKREMAEMKREMAEMKREMAGATVEAGIEATERP